jgi:cell division protein FtsI/penicillin-binding protein 2
VSVSEAFANSCNTTFAVASRMPPRALTQTAIHYGIVGDYLVDGSLPADFLT